MGMMKRLLAEAILEADWQVLPVVPYEGRYLDPRYRLMEHIGKGRWVERSRGTLKALQAQADQNIKEGYHTVLKPEEIVERERFSVMERMRLVVK